MSVVSGDGVLKNTFIVPDVRCAACCLKIEQALGRLEGVSEVNVNYAQKRLTFTAANDDFSDAAIQQLEAMGYSSSPERENGGLQMLDEQRRRMLARLGVAGIGMMQVMMFALTNYLAGAGGIEPAYETLMRWASFVIAVPVTFYAAMPFHQGALRDVRNLSPGMDVPVSLAILSAFGLSAFNTVFHGEEVYFDSACMFTFFLLTGRYLELTARQNFHVDQSLGEHLLPERSASLAKDDLVEIAPGEIVPADALVLEGASSCDESAFTGETEPVTKSVGAGLLAGSRNLDGHLTARVSSDRDDWVITHLSELYRQSAAFRPAFAILADVIARYFVTVVLLLALASGTFWYFQGAENWFAIALAVLVVSCPCALSLATPVAYTIASGAVKDIGVLIASGAFLEKLASVSAVVFDKTGTLTEGSLKLVEVRPVTDIIRDEALTIAASLETGSLHPIATTLREATDAILPVVEPEIEPGVGVTGVINGVRWQLGKPDREPPDQNNNWVLLRQDGEAVCWFAFTDRLRAGAEAVVTAARQSLAVVTAYSGDSSATGRDKLLALGIEQPQMSMSPDMKIAAMRRLQDEHKVLMVGDGLNDAGAMAVADVSLAVNPVDSVVQSAADATLVNGDLGSVPRLLVYAQRVRKIIRQNLTWAFLYNLSVIPLAIAGLIQPWVAALGMSLSSLLVTLNATRLARIPERNDLAARAGDS